MKTENEYPQLNNLTGAELEGLLQDIGNRLIEKNATIKDSFEVGMNIIIGSWKCCPNKEECVDDFIDTFVRNFRAITSKIMIEGE